MLDKGWTETGTRDRRQAMRRRMRRPATMVVNNGWSTFDTVVLNLSPEGALMQIGGEMPVPEVFQLRYDGLKKRARRIWARRDLVGLKFEEE